MARPGEERVRRACRSAAGSVLLILITGLTPALGQVYEDVMEPEELGIRDIDQLAEPTASYVGNDVCAGCHAEAYQIWLGTKHARAFIPMRSMMGMMMGERAGITSRSPAQSGICLSCHATAHDVPASFREPGFRMGEGVCCEKCHGPGGDHVRVMETGSGTGPDYAPKLEEDTCLRCHRAQESHEMVTEGRHFSFEMAWKKIAHPEE